MKFCRSEFVEPKVKVYLLNEGYTCVKKKKKRDFTEDPKEEIWKNQSFRDYEVFSRPPTILLLSKR